MDKTSRTRSRFLVTLAAAGLAIAFAFDAAEGKPKPAEESPAEDAGSKAANKRKPAKNEPKSEKADTPSTNKSSDKPEQLGSYGEWGAYAAQNGRNRTCYALGQPKEHAEDEAQRRFRLYFHLDAASGKYPQRGGN